MPGKSRDLDELLGFLLDLALQATAAGGASLQVPDGESLRVVMTRGSSAPLAGSLVPLAGTTAGECWYRGKLVTGTERAPESRQSDLWRQDLDVEVMAVPVHRAGQAFGVLVVHHHHPGHFSRTDASAVGRLADLASSLWAETPGPESERRAGLELQAAARLALIASSQLDEREVWLEIAQSAGMLLNAASVRVATLEGTDTVCQAALGRFTDQIGARRACAGGFDGAAIDRIDGLLLTDRDPARDFPHHDGWIRSLLAVPIRRVEMVLGTITVADQAPGRFTERDRATLLRFGLHAAAALTEGRLQREEARRIEENRIAAAAAGVLSSAPDTPSLRRAIVEELRHALVADGARLSEVIQEQWAVTAIDGGARIIQQPPLPGQMLLCGHPLAEGEPTHRCVLPDGEGYLIAAEMGHTAQHLGLIQVVRIRTPFSIRDEQLLGRLADIAAVALVTRIAHIRLSQYADRIRSVAEVSATLHQALTARDAVRQAAEILQRALGVESLCIAWVDEARGEVAFPVYRMSGENRDGHRRPLEQGLIEKVWRSGVTVFCPQAAGEELRRMALRHVGAPRTLAAVALRTRGAVRGVITIEDGRRDQAFEAEDVRILEIVSQQLGVTLENIETFEEERRQRITADWLRQMARTATDRSAVPTQILEMAADAAFQGVTGVSSLVCYLPTEDTQRILGVRGETLAQLPGKVRLLPGALAHWVVSQQGATFISPNTAEDKRFELEVRRGFGPWAVVGAPVWSEQRIVAILVLIREPGVSFAAGEVERLAQIADHAGAGYQTARSTEALRQSEERYRKLISAATDAIFTLDREGRITSFNEAAERLWGTPAGEALGEGWDVVLQFEPQEKVAEQIQRGMTGQSSSFDSLVRPRDGERRNVALSISPLVEAGETIAVLGIVRDVTDQNRMQAQLLQAEKMSAIGQLVGGMAHEINNPLASIVVNMELLLQDVRDPAQLETLQAIKVETDRAAVIVRNLLTYVRGQGSERSVLDLRETIRSAMALRRYQLLNQQIQVTTEVGREPVLIWANNVNLQQVLMNLIVNAEHAIRSYRGSGHVWIRVLPAHGRAVVTVEDDGPGIPPELMTRIFDPFFTTKPEGEGTGLGLSVSAGIVADHRGRLYAERRPGGGARFVMDLPLHQAEAPARGGSSRVPLTVAGPSTGKKVLLIDDEPDIRRSISKFLIRSGWDVFVADSGEEGLRLVELGSFDVVLCDLRMPGMSGHEFYRRLEASGSPAVRRLVFMTGDVVSPEAQSFLADAARPVLSKPFALQELIEVLSQVTAA